MIYFEYIKKEALCYEFSCRVAISSRLVASKQLAHKPSTALLVVAEENLDGQPGVTADLEAVGEGAELLHLVVGEGEVELEVVLNARGSDGLGDNGVAANLGPGKDDLGGSGLVLLSDLLDDVVLNEKRETKHVVSESLE